MKNILPTQSFSIYPQLYVHAATATASWSKDKKTYNKKYQLGEMKIKPIYHNYPHCVLLVSASQMLCLCYGDRI